MKSKYFPLNFVFMVALSGCSKQSNPMPFEVVYERSGTDGVLITGVGFKDLRNNIYRRYNPEKDFDDSSSMGSLYFDNVVSPKYSWVILPRGRFDGFVFCPYSELPLMLDRKKGVVFYVDIPPNFPRLVYKFEGWRNDDEVIINVGISGEMGSVILNLKNRLIVKNDTRLDGAYMKFFEIEK